MIDNLRASLAAEDVPRGRRIACVTLALAAAAALWIPAVHFLFRVSPREYTAPEGIPPMARALAARHLDLWTRPDLREREIGRMRVRNAEWDFMGRTFLVLALANMGLRDPAEADRGLEVIDRILDETLRLEREHGIYFFLMPYARTGRFKADPPRSLFLDGEIALMLAARRMLREREDYKPLLAGRVRAIEESMGRGPVLCAESYPDECWMFCNTAALAALRMADALDGSNHGEFFARWVETARAKLVDPGTGLLVSSFTHRGMTLDGPEGSSIFMAAHGLQLVDEAFARDQYARARKELGRTVLGFGFAREWPASRTGPRDIDSGPIIPVLEVSAGSSGLAFLGAGAFGDDTFLGPLLTSLEFAGFPRTRAGALKYCASNPVGDAVLLYGAVQGPLWKKAREGAPHGR
jgi:hypothetical protein